VILDDTGKSKKYAAVPIEAYFDQMERNFAEKRKKIEDSLKSIKIPPPDSGVYQLENVSQIFEKADQMIRNAKTSIFINISPGISHKFKKSLESAAKANVDVLVRPYQETEIPGCDISYSALIDPPGKSVPFELLYLVTDGEEYILAFLDLSEKKVFKAIWSKNIHLTMIAYYGNLFEFLFVKSLNMLQSDFEKQEILSSLEKYFKYRITDIASFNENFNTIGG
jgi:sugar-specific transcriptional regulator TrmB